MENGEALGVGVEVLQQCVVPIVSGEFGGIQRYVIRLTSVRMLRWQCGVANKPFQLDSKGVPFFSYIGHNLSSREGTAAHR